MLSDQELAARLRTRASELGFSLMGIAAAARPDTFDLFRDWIRQGFHGEMNYLASREDAYADPQGVMIGVRSIIVAAVDYGSGREQGDRIGRIAAYAQGTADYHDVLRKKLKQLSAVLHESRPGSRSRVTVDTAPLLERDIARRAGLGWFGKNTMLINKYAGSYFFLGGILTDCPLPPDPAHEASHCGTCTRCLEACPTDAFVAPHILDARKCIAYLTIELRDEPIPMELRSGMQDWMFGCDICQQVCPWNRKAAPTTLPEFRPADFTTLDAMRFLEMDAESFKTTLGKTPLSRPGAVNMARNAAIVLGNNRDTRAVDSLTRALCSESPIVRGASAWALGQIGGTPATEALQQQARIETDNSVQAELSAALQSADSHSTP